MYCLPCTPYKLRFGPEEPSTMWARDFCASLGNDDMGIRCRFVLSAEVSLPENIELVADSRCRPESPEFKIKIRGRMPNVGDCSRSGAKKNPKAKIRTNSTKEFSEQFEGTTPQSKGLEANLTRKFTRKFGKIFVAKVLWGTFSVPNKGGKGRGVVHTPVRVVCLSAVVL